MKKNTITILTLIALIGSYSSLAQNWVLGGNTVLPQAANQSNLLIPVALLIL